MALATPFQAAAGNAIASYDFADVQEGVGYVKYYGANQRTSGAIGFALATATRDPYTLETSGAIAGTNNWHLDFDLDFDVTFNTPKIVDGTGRFIFTTSLNAGVGTNAYIEILVRKWDGTTETTIVADQTEAFTETFGKKRWVMPITIPRTHFKKGETLRVTLDYWANQASSTHTIYIAHDPQNRSSPWFTVGTATGNVTGTTMECYIPFDIRNQ